VIRRAVALLLALSLGAHAAPRRRPIGSPVRGLRDVGRVLIVILENTDASAAEAQPFLRQLGARGAMLRTYRAVTHPSQPNYIAMVSGSTHGVDGSDPVTLPVPHLGDLLEQRGLRWKVYAEGYPGNCFLGVAFGRYVRRHVPFLSFVNVQNDFQRCSANIVDATRFDADLAANALPAFAMYIPDLDNDGHDTGVAFADAWLASRFGPILDSGGLPADTLFIVMFDEGTTGSANIVYCSFNGAGVRPGAVSTEPYNHYDLLRTFEEIFRTGSLGQNDARARVIGDVWR